MITIVARYQASPGRGDAVAHALAEHVPTTLREEGCLEFTALRSEEDPDSFVLYERYVDEKALTAHRQSTHFRRYVENTIIPLLAEREWSRYDMIGKAQRQ
jgi:quinol monooxygenase YgiN